MADVAPTKLVGVGGSDVFEFNFTATNKTTAPFQLDPRKVTTIAVQTTGSATVLVGFYLEDPDNASAVQFPFIAAAATGSGIDSLTTGLEGIAGLEFTGTVAGGDTAIIQVLQSERV